MATFDVTPEMARAADAVCVFTNLDTVTEAATQLFDEALGPSAISVEQLGYLVCIKGMPGMSVDMRAQRKCKDPMHVRTALLRMEARGWLQPLGEDDEPLALTPFGEAKLDDGATRWAGMQERIVETMGGEDVWKETLERLSLLQACIRSAR